MVAQPGRATVSFGPVRRVQRKHPYVADRRSEEPAFVQGRLGVTTETDADVFEAMTARQRDPILGASAVVHPLIATISKRSSRKLGRRTLRFLQRHNVGSFVVEKGCDEASSTPDRVHIPRNHTHSIRDATRNRRLGQLAINASTSSIRDPYPDVRQVPSSSTYT